MHFSILLWVKIRHEILNDPLLAILIDLLILIIASCVGDTPSTTLIHYLLSHDYFLSIVLHQVRRWKFENTVMSQNDSVKVHISNL